MAEDYSKRLPYVMRRVSQALSGRLERILQPFGLTHAQLSALAQLGLEPGRGASGALLARGAGLTPQSMSEAVTSLLERGLVTRTPHPTHGRVLEVRITEAGLDLLAEAQQASAAVEDHALADLSERDREQLRELLRQVMSTLQIDPAPHWRPPDVPPARLRPRLRPVATRLARPVTELPSGRGPTTAETEDTQV